MNAPLTPKFVRLETLSAKSSQEINERWVQSVIQDDPTVLGLGNVVLVNRERIQAGGGRLDLLLQDEDRTGWYEVEIQLGPTDESHIIRTLEYWDTERRRYPQLQHTAVIVAEEITGRFFNVIRLFNGFIPIMAIQMNLVRQPDGIGVLFTRVLDTVAMGTPETEEPPPNTDRNYWETELGTPKTVELADRMLDLIHTFDANAKPSYNKYYIGIWIDGRACNFARFIPQRKAMLLLIALPKTSEFDEQLEKSGLDVLSYDKGWKEYRIKLREPDITAQRDLLIGLPRKAYDFRKGE